MQMSITKEEFIYRNDELLSEIEQKSGEAIFKDGPFNPGVYYDTHPKILWILKEAYGDPVSYPELITTKFDEFIDKFVYGKPRHTWLPISLVTHALHNGYKEYNSTLELSEIISVLKSSLEKAAFININKNSSETGGRSLHSNVKDAATFYEQYLDKQLKLFTPDIVICGNTFQFLKHRFKNPNVIKEVDGVKYVDHYHIGGTLYLDPYHPAYTAYGTIDIIMYINDIVRTIKDNYKK